MKQPFSYAEFKSIYSKVPRLTVEVVIKTDQGVLLSLRDLASWKGQWHLPGGTVYYGERLEEAVQRIAQEELGVKVDVGKMLGYLHYPSEKKERGFGWSVGIAFLCKIKSGTLRGSDQAKQLGFFHQLPSNTIKEAKDFLKKTVLKNQK